MKDSVLLVHPTCGPTQPGDIDGIVRIQTYEALKAETAQEYPMPLESSSATCTLSMILQSDPVLRCWLCFLDPCFEAIPN